MNTKNEEALLFYIDDLPMAIRLAEMHDVLENFNHTKVPLSGSSVLGITNLRGKIVTILDVESSIFSKPKVLSFRYGLVAEYKDELYCIAVHKLGESVTIHDDGIQPIPGTIDPLITKMAKTFIYLDEQMVFLLSIDSIVNYIINNEYHRQ